MIYIKRGRAGLSVTATFSDFPMPPKHPPLTARDRLDWLRLIRSENVGPATFWQLLARYGTARDALDALPELARRGGLTRRIRICSRRDAEDEMERAERCGAALLALPDSAFPVAVAALDPAPPLLYVRGHAVLLQKSLVAMVGARNASAAGRKFAHDLARELSAEGWPVVSGLARGIDTAAHRGALATGTIAVLAGGVDSVYPQENRDLYDAIAESGAIISERAMGLTAQARDFPRRNRLISGLSLGVVVVEASFRSGSLITARLAAEQGREVMAVPGSPLDPRHRGTNDLIRQGATLVENAEQVIDVLTGCTRKVLDEPAGWDDLTPDPEVSRMNEEEIDRLRSVVIKLLSPTPTEIDELIRQSGATPAVVHTVLLELDLAARLERHPGGRVSLL